MERRRQTVSDFNETFIGFSSIIFVLIYNRKDHDASHNCIISHNDKQQGTNPDATSVKAAGTHA